LGEIGKAEPNLGRRARPGARVEEGERAAGAKSNRRHLPCLGCRFGLDGTRIFQAQLAGHAHSVPAKEGIGQ